MAKVEIYTKASCPHCKLAKALLESKGVEFIEIPVDLEQYRRPEMIKRANGRHTVPQIFIDGKHIGGSDDLHHLEEVGKLDPLLK